jgi:dolichol-phosphate mannosyltransferase
MNTVVIIIPAFHEFENLKILIPRIRSLFPAYDIVVIDDSPTSEQGRQEAFFQKDTSHIHIINRNTKSGRGSAVIEGIRFAVNQLRATVCVEMDADQAHDPVEITSLLNHIKQADLVIGSRYMKGSMIIKWPLRRLVQSRIINFFLRYWLGLPLSDFTNGFRAYSKKACDILLTHTLHEKGYIALSESAFMLKRYGCTLTEVPVSFTDRTLGKSNAGFRELVTSLLGAMRIPFRA